ncbi:MAG: hypothetical protein QMD14_04355 [Candidatus Aenigmarchaeota archaeon]|nr:hypothetical protein [Candidatus Aenigmarchaeota archaeon]
MKAQFAVSEAILIIGVIIASGITILQLRAMYEAQTAIAKEEVVVRFARDLESIVDKAIATTGDVAFVYYPGIKKYSVKIENNTVLVLDKISNKSAIFSKSMPEVIDNYFEDSEKITIIKKENKIFVIGKCIENGNKCLFSLSCCSGFCWGNQNNFVCQESCALNGEYAADSLSCCSGYLNVTSGKCDKIPICPAERRCTGAPEAEEDSLGNDCCPLDKPKCSNGHCCPSDKPNYCKMPKPGYDEGCMSEDEYKQNCIIEIWDMVYVPLNYGAGEFNLFKSAAELAFNYWIQKSPFRECPDVEERIKAHFVDTSICSPNCNRPCQDCIQKAIECARKYGQEKFGNPDFWDKVAGMSKIGFGSIIGCGPWNWKTCSGGPASTTYALYPKVVSHEVGHTLNLCHECGLARPPGCPNPDVYDDRYIMCYGSLQLFSPESYNYLKGDRLGYCNEKSEIAKFVEGC